MACKSWKWSEEVWWHLPLRMSFCSFHSKVWSCTIAATWASSPNARIIDCHWIADSLHLSILLSACLFDQAVISLSCYRLPARFYKLRWSRQNWKSLRALRFQVHQNSPAHCEVVHGINLIVRLYRLGCFGWQTDTSTVGFLWTSLL